ncbi:hypothetical protein VZT92_008934 [Zoarces viviparus]|uniref:Uncharacterized protein n=1 Tax=Zoarces viviparus TaxID=48416 RepID=A0AAW1FGB7_ZOAVI
MKRLTQSTALELKTQTGNAFIIMHQRRSGAHILQNLSLLKTRMAGCGSCFWGIFWLVVLICIGWPLSITLGALYGLVSPLTTCLGLDRISDLLLEGANLGRTCANNMRHGKPLC